MFRRSSTLKKPDLFNKNSFSRIVRRPLDEQKQSTLLSYLKKTVGESETVTYRGIIRYLQRDGNTVMIMGGFVRDLIRGSVSDSKMLDIDINHTASSSRVTQMQSELSIKQFTRDETRTPPYFCVGDSRGEHLDAFQFPKGGYRTHHAEAPINFLFIELDRKCQSATLVDPTGIGRYDSQQLVWRCPCAERRRKRTYKKKCKKQWANATLFAPNEKLIFRMLKFRQRGYNIDPWTEAVLWDRLKANPGLSAYTKARIWKLLDPADYESIRGSIPNPAHRQLFETVLRKNGCMPDVAGTKPPFAT
jgi:hypothetical protein